jgi:hypothetical protein
MGNATSAVQAGIECQVQRLPTVLSTHVAQFSPELSSPAPSLKRARNSLLNQGFLELLGVNNNGDQFYSAPGDVYGKGQRILCCKNDAEQKVVESYLSDGWRLGFKLICRYQQGVYLVREAANGHRMLGSYDVHTESIQELGALQTSDVVIAVNSRSALILATNNHLTYWISNNKQGLGEQRILLPHSNRYTYQNVQLDPVSNTVIWKHSLFSDNLLIKDFDTAADPLHLTVRSSEPNIRVCHNDGILVTTTHKQASASNHTVKICCYTKDKQWQPSITVSQNFSHPAIVHPIALSVSASVVLCSFQTQIQKDGAYAYAAYPAIMSLKTGSLVCDQFIGYHGYVGEFLLSPNGRWIAGTICRQTFLWEVRGLNLKPGCTFVDRLCLIEFKKIYDRAKEMRAQYHLTPDQFELYVDLLNNPDCEVPDEWGARFLPWKALATKITTGPAGIVREYMGK